MSTREGERTVEGYLSNYGERIRSLETHTHPVDPAVSSLVFTGGSGGDCILVAASDAPLSVQADASFICDGTNDEVEINAAITQLTLTLGGKVCLSEGTFYIAGPAGAGTIVIDRQVYLSGAGPESTTITTEGSGTGPVALIEVNPVAGAVADGSVVADIGFDKLSGFTGTKPIRSIQGGEMADLTIFRCHFRDWESVPTIQTSSPRTHVLFCKFFNNLGAALFIDQGADYSLFYGNYVDMSGSDFSVNGCAHSIAANYCKITGNVYIGTQVEAIIIGNCSHNQVALNHFIDCCRGPFDTTRYNVIDIRASFGGPSKNYIGPGNIVRTSQASKHGYVVQARIVAGATAPDQNTVAHNDFNTTHGTGCVEGTADVNFADWANRCDSSADFVVNGVTLA